MTENLIKFNDSAIDRLCKEKKEYYRREGRGFAIRVYPTEKKAFYFFYSFDGVKKKILIGPYFSKNDKKNQPDKGGINTESARDRHADLVKLVQSGIDPMAPLPRPALPENNLYTVNNLLDAYLSDFENKSKSLANVNNVKTTLRKALDLLLLKPVCDVKRKHAIDIIEKKAETHHGQAHNIRKGARAMWSWALERELVDSNPFASIGKTILKPPVSKDRTLSDDEIKSFWYGIENCCSPTVRAALRLILITGQRPGEIAGLKSDEIDWYDWWVIPIHRTKYKTSSHRVFLSPLAIKILRDSDRNIKISRAVLSRRLKGITIPGIDTPFTPHDLRRSMSTGLSNIGCSDAIIDAILAHEKQGIIRTYNRNPYDAEKKEWLTKWAAHLEVLLDIVPPVEWDVDDYILVGEDE